ncbi:putative protein kinase RLK-Pelle-DLSV family [Helianthus anomalus]
MERTPREIYYQYNLINSSVYTRLVLKPNGRLDRLLWVDSINDWNIILAPESDICDRYKVCGPFGSCNIDNTPVYWSQGCQHRIPLDCEPGEGFNKYSNLKLSNTRGSWYNQTMTLVECEKSCKSNCSCTAYTNSNISGPGSGYLLWYGDLVDIRTVPQNGDPLYIRVLHSEIGRPRNENNSENRSGDEDFELPLFGLSTILEATNNFSLNSKLGEGGFGPVYKGVLKDEKEIAVKRLAKTSTQGLYEFKNEVISISRLQHRNLVKLFGCCIEGTEKKLIYEYMPNKGLNSFLFGK